MNVRGGQLQVEKTQVNKINKNQTNEHKPIKMYVPTVNEIHMKISTACIIINYMYMSTN